MRHNSRLHAILALGLTLAASSAVGSSTDARVYDIQPPPTFRPAYHLPNAQKQIDAIEAELQQAGTPHPLIKAFWDVRWNQQVAMSFEPPAPLHSNADGDDISKARAFLRDHQPLFGLSPRAIDDLRAERIPGPNQIIVRFTQSYGGIPFVEHQGQFRVVLARGGVLSVSGRYWAGAPPSTKPKLDVTVAFSQMRRELPNLWKSFDGNPSFHDGQTGKPTFAPNSRLDLENAATHRLRRETLIQHVGMDFTDELNAHLSFYMDGPRVWLVWEFELGYLGASFPERMKGDGIATMQVLIDARNGRLLVAHVLTDPGPTPVNEGR